MNRNAESHFALAPATMDLQRSQFDRSHGNTFTCNFGELIPCYIEEVLPGDTFNVKSSKVVRLQTLLKPVMGNMYLDTYYFFVPNRLVWDHWKEFCGESNQAWTPLVEYSIPQIAIPEGGFEFGSLADYLGVPPKRGYFDNGNPLHRGSVSHLPFRAYAKIVDDWFRNQNLEDPINIYTGDAVTEGSTSVDSELINGHNLYIAGKYHDMFTSCLPAPQKGPAVEVPLSWQSGVAPVVPLKSNMFVPDQYSNPVAIQLYDHSINQPDGSGYMIAKPLDSGGIGDIGVGPNPSSGQVTYDAAYFTNLGIDASMMADITGTVSVSDMRMSFAIQRYYEKLARGGSRYIEILKSMFNVTSPDARLQRSEYLGGNRMPISVSQVTNNAESVDNPLGNVGALSLTNDINNDFIHSFTEHGYVIGVCVARYEHSYPQGLPRHFSRKDKFDFYWPCFANISEQPIKRSEIYLEENPAVNVMTFGYQEPWAHYRYGFNSVHGEMRPDHPQTLASWNLSDDYASRPFLSHEWAMEDKTNVDRTLAVTSEVADQLLIDMWFNNMATRPMPMYSIPGLIDHH